MVLAPFEGTNMIDINDLPTYFKALPERMT